jgi:AraC-like DNA-binding protein
MFEVLYLGSVFFAICTVYLLIFKEGATRSYADYLLAFFFLMEIWCVLIYLLIYSGWINNVPHLYKTAAPINFILPPLGYLYVRAVLYNEKRVRFVDIFHFIPFSLFFLNYLPFYSLSIVVKKEIVEATTHNMDLVYQYQTGIVPEYLNFVLRPLQSIVYLIFQWQLIVKFKKQNNLVPIQRQINNVIKWLKIFTGAITFFIVGFVCLIFIVLIFKGLFSESLVTVLPSFLLVLGFFITSIYLIINPTVLLGFPFIKYNSTTPLNSIEAVNKETFIYNDYTNEIKLLLNYFEIRQAFLVSNLTITHVAVELSISVRDISYIINNYYGVRFNDFINGYRLDYIINKCNNNYLDDFTIESIAKEAGFSSKSTFYRIFSKTYQTTPTEYFDKAKL